MIKYNKTHIYSVLYTVSSVNLRNKHQHQNKLKILQLLVLQPILVMEVIENSIIIVRDGKIDAIGQCK